MSIAGHVSRAILSRYSHVRMEGKRRALDGGLLPGDGLGLFVQRESKPPGDDGDAGVTKQIRPRGVWLTSQGTDLD
jgi:hypothetical protein